VAPGLPAFYNPAVYVTASALSRTDVTGSHHSPASRDIDRVLAAVGPLPACRERPALLVVSGLPGTGKSRLCRSVHDSTQAVILASDALRRLLFGQPGYSYPESRRLFAAIHAAIDRLLADGRSVILDATNLAEREREPLYSIAERRKARLLLVQTVSPPEVVRRRLASRRRGQDPQDLSQADVEVYRRMLANKEPIQRPHRVIDTSGDTKADVRAIAEEMESP